MPIKHGWLASPEDQETFSVLEQKARDYDTAVTFVAEGDAIAKGAVTASNADTADLTEQMEALSLASTDQQTLVQQASVVHRFLQSSSTQLTYAGLFSLSESLAPGSLCALFRNAHFSVLYRHPEPSGTPALFHLVTDAALLHSRDCIWESLADTDGAASAFYDADLRPARISQDWVGRDAQAVREQQTEEQRRRDEHDQALAVQMQQDEYDREDYHRQQERRTGRTQQLLEPIVPSVSPPAAPASRTPAVQALKHRPAAVAGKEKKTKGKKECIVS